MIATDHSTVSDVFFRLKSFLLADAGMTVARAINAFDTILDAGGGTFLRLKKESPADGIEAVGIKFGTDLDVLETSEMDCREDFPFWTVGGDLSLGLEWREGMLQVFFAGDHPKRYRADIDVLQKRKNVFHQNHLAPTKQPNFYLSGGEYIKCGA